MKNIYRSFFVILILLYSKSFAATPPPVNLVDIRVTQVSNTYNSPIAGRATLILDIEAQSSGAAVDISTFQDAIQVNADLLAQINAGGSVSFSDNLSLASLFGSSFKFYFLLAITRHQQGQMLY